MGGGFLTSIDDQGSQLEAEELEEALLDPSALSEAVEGFTKRRVELVQKAAKEWRQALEDLGGRNNLLSYSDRQAATLDLTNADQRAVASLLQSKAVKTSALFPDPEERAAQLSNRFVTGWSRRSPRHVSTRHTVARGTPIERSGRIEGSRVRTIIVGSLG